MVGLAAAWFDNVTIDNVALVSRACRNAVACLKFHKEVETTKKENLFRNVMRGLAYYFDIRDPELLTKFRDKIFSLKYYQVCTMIDNWGFLSRWTQRSMVKSVFFALKIFYLKKSLVFFPAIILASDLTPGKFWETWRNYTEKKIFLAHPDFEEEDQTTKNLIARYYMQRGLDGLSNQGTSDLQQLILGARRFAVNFDDEMTESDFSLAMEDNWNSLAYILHRYSVDPLCHLPIACLEYDDCQHWGRDQELAPDTELYNMEDGDFHEFRYDLAPKYGRDGLISIYE